MIFSRKFNLFDLVLDRGVTWSILCRVNGPQFVRRCVSNRSAFTPIIKTSKTDRSIMSIRGLSARYPIEPLGSFNFILFFSFLLKNITLIYTGRLYSIYCIYCIYCKSILYRLYCIVILTTGFQATLIFIKYQNDKVFL